MYVVQGVTVQFGNNAYYNVLDTKDGVAENVNVDLISKDCLFFGDIYTTRNQYYEKQFYASRNYKMVDDGLVGSRKPKFYAVNPTYRVYDILSPLDGVYIDNSFMLCRESDTSFSISIFNSDMKGLVELRGNNIFVRDIEMFGLYYDNCKLGVCEIEKIVDLDSSIIYRLHMIAIDKKDYARHEFSEDLYLDLNAKYGYVSCYCRGDYYNGSTRFKTKKVAFSKKQEMKLTLGGVW